MTTPTNTAQATYSPHEKATAGYLRHFQGEPALVAQAPGRVNLIGEHTDYNDGFVFPVAINFHTCVAAAARNDRSIHAVALDEGSQQVRFSIDEPPQFDSNAPWSNYVRGVVSELTKAGYALTGANLSISGDVPLGAGLSSSAALEMSIIAALTKLSDEPISAADAARIGQAAENNFVGCQCGIMDQMISAAGQAEHALMLDCRTLSLTKAQLPEKLAIVVINSNMRRALVDGEYNQRRAQCEAAARHFSVNALRDLSIDRLLAAEGQLDDLAFRRARHVVTENARTEAMHRALSSKDLNAIGRLMADSHTSMRDDFEITTPQIDGLVEIVKTEIGSEGGVRMTGGGFGGCVVALIPKTKVTNVLEAVDEKYPALAGHAADAFVCSAANGAFVTH